VTRWAPFTVPACIASGVVAADVLTKLLAARRHIAIPVAPGVILQRVENLSGPFRAMSVAVAIVLSVAVLVLLLTGFFRATSPAERVGYSLALGGGSANFLERIVFGRTTDIVLVAGTSAWNIADAAIVIGCVVLAVVWLRPRALPLAA
jgi:lipoprotein signal peptidase